MNPVYKYLTGQNKKIESYLHIIGQGMTVITAIVSLLFIIVLGYEYGFKISEKQNHTIHLFYNWVWVLFFTDVVVHLLLQYARFSDQNYRRLAWILSVFVCLGVMPVFFSKPPGNGTFYVRLWSILSSDVYAYIVLFLFSMLNLSNALIRTLGKKTNPSLMLAGSFLVFIVIGTGLLMMPRCTVEGISWIDALFVSTSAVCVTGLSSVDFATTFTPQGMFIVIILVQAGGLGVMTLTSFFALFFMGNTSLYNQLVVRDIINSNSLNSLFSTLFYILMFTLMIELGGMVVIWLTIQSSLGLTLEEELIFSAFHSVSSFCNAGFTTLPGNFGDPLVVHNNSLLLTISFLVILGGIGFPILANFKNILVYRFKRLGNSLLLRSQKTERLPHIYNLNTRIVLTTTAILFAVTTLLFAYFEWNHAFTGLSVADKWTHSFFNAVCPRSGGFMTANLSLFGVQAILIYIFMMWIGGGSQSTAGGIKVNAFAVIVLNMVAILRNSDRVEAFGREIPPDSIRRANATMVMSLGVLFFSVLLLSILDPELPLFSLVFECVSALSTTGASLNTSSLLSDYSKIYITFLMFIGRIGLITIMLGLIKQKDKMKYRYPQEQIIIN